VQISYFENRRQFLSRSCLLLLKKLFHNKNAQSAERRLAMRRSKRGTKLSDVSGWVARMLRECDPNGFRTLNEDDLADLKVRFAATLLHLNLKPRVFLPF
jgi:hypothetical protein